MGVRLLERKKTFKTFPSATTLLAQCSELRAEEAGVTFQAPIGLQRMGTLPLFRNTHQVVGAQYHHFSASGYLRHHVNGTQENIWNELREMSGYKRVRVRLGAARKQPQFLEEHQDP